MRVINPQFPPPHLLRPSSSGGQALVFIRQQVAEFYHVSISDIDGRSRLAPIVWPRQVFHALAAELLGLSVSSLSRLVQRHHGTLFHSVAVVKNICDVYPQVAAEVAELRTTIKRGLQL
jgi:chromosomal replication initiator protein